MKRSRYRIVVSAGYLSLSGVHVFAIHLVRGLCERGLDAELLLTEQNTELISLPPQMMPLPNDIPIRELPVDRKAHWGRHWYETIRYIESQGPCVFLPNADYRHSCVSPKLSSRVSVVGVIQADDPIHYEHVERLGRFWDATVCVSQRCATGSEAVEPSIAPRTYVIPNAVPVPPRCPPRDFLPGAPLRIVYHGVLNTYQKRIFDIPKVAQALAERGVPFKITLVGAGAQQPELAAACEPLIRAGQLEILGMIPNEQVHAMLREQDVYLLMSAFEGMPHAMLEGMAAGCVPVVSDIESGIPEVVHQGINGYRVTIGDIDGFAARLEELARDPEKRRRMSVLAHQTVLHSRFNCETMVDAYMRVFERVRRDSEAGIYVRPQGPVLPPPAECNGLSLFPVEHAGEVAEVEQLLPPSIRETRWYERKPVRI